MNKPAYLSLLCLRVLFIIKADLGAEVIPLLSAKSGTAVMFACDVISSYCCNILMQYYFGMHFFSRRSSRHMLGLLSVLASVGLFVIPIKCSFETLWLRHTNACGLLRFSAKRREIIRSAACPIFQIFFRLFIMKP